MVGIVRDHGAHGKDFVITSPAEVIELNNIESFSLIKKTLKKRCKIGKK